MKRRLFNLLAGASLILCLTTLALWATHPVGRQIWHLTYDSGPKTTATQNNIDIVLAQDSDVHYNTNHFTRWTYLEITLPYWLAAGIFLLLPLCWLLIAKKSSVVLPGVCRVCGYDLRATPERCLECGNSASFPL